MNGLIFLCALFGQPNGLCVNDEQKVCVQFDRVLSDAAGTYKPTIIECPKEEKHK